MRVLLGAAVLTLSSFGAAVVSVNTGDEVAQSQTPAGCDDEGRESESEPRWSDSLEARLRARLNAAVELDQREGGQSQARKRRSGCTRCGGCRSSRAAPDEDESTETDASGVGGDTIDFYSCCGYGVFSMGHLASAAPSSSSAAPSRFGALDDDTSSDASQSLITGDSASIEGVVVDAQTGEGLAALALQLTSDGEPVALATTDESGAFRFAGLEAGDYVVSAASAEATGPPRFESAPLALAAGQLVSDLVLDSN